MAHKFRWEQKQTGMLADGAPDEAAPKGWNADPGKDGAWRLVAIVSPSRMVWQRLLKRSSARAARSSSDGVQGWAKGISNREPAKVQECALRCVEALTGERPAPNRAKTSARSLLALYRSLGCPQLRQFFIDFRLVARAFRECPAPLFARDVRAEGWPEGVDRSTHMTTICVQEKWDDRLREAKAWAEGGYKTTVAAKPDGGTARPIETPKAAPAAELPSMRGER